MRSSAGSLNITQTGTGSAHGGRFAAATAHRMMNTFSADGNTDTLIGDVQFDSWGNFFTLFESHTHNDSPSLEVYFPGNREL